jgi:hypothetical protein
MKYTDNIVIKVMRELDFNDEIITYRTFVDKFSQKFILRNRQQLMKFAFELVDDD